MTLGLLALLVLHAAAAVAWWWLMPGGFPAGHPRFWMNQVAPAAVLALLAAIGWARARGAGTFTVVLPALWLGAAAGAASAFPRSGLLVALAALVPAALGLWAAWPLRWRSRAVWVTAAVAVAAGAIAPWLERAPDARTRPLGGTLAAPPAQVSRPAVAVVTLAAHLRADLAAGRARWDAGRLTLEVSPLLTFVSRSPDRGWTVLASARDRLGPRRELLAVEGAGERAASAWYRDDDLTTLAVAAQAGGGAHLDAASRLARDVFSHLNTFTEVVILGHRRLALGFSPCGAARFEVTFNEYPSGRPARFAYFDPGRGRFVVVEATDAEKGPFRTLGEGALARGQPLAITIFDQDRAAATLTFDDWSAQATDQLSPTAGWRVSAGSVQFALAADAPTSPAALWLSLAETGVGRGWDAVGHARGTYRNRVHLAPAVAP